jgi:hypothetical protein
MAHASVRVRRVIGDRAIAVSLYKPLRPAENLQKSSGARKHFARERVVRPGQLCTEPPLRTF